jgi:sortase A
MMSTGPGRLPAARIARVSLWVERFMWTIGIAVSASWALAAGAGAIGARHELQRFADLQTAGLSANASPDQRLWSPERRRAWHDAAADDNVAPLAVLRIPKIELEVAVLPGTSEWALNRAVGHIDDTALPGSDGNAGIAGHRDGFFRGLKDVQPGDVLEIETLTSLDTYRIERTWIVNPEDVSVLDPTASSAITLVTCYPFYFIGSAPQRFIVRAVRTQAVPKHPVLE